MNRTPMSTASCADVGLLRPLLQKSRFKPSRFLYGEIGEGLTALWLAELAQLGEKGDGTVFLATTTPGQVVGMAAYADLPWDTKVLGRAMGALRYVVADPDVTDRAAVMNDLLERVTDVARSRGVEFLLCKPYTDDTVLVHALQQHGFRLMDTVLDYVYESSRDPLADVPRPRLAPGFQVRLAGPPDLEGLLQVARACFGEHMGRFHCDPRIPRREATRVYEEWIRSAVAGYADWVFAAETGGRIAGYSAWRRPSALEQAHHVRLGHYSIGAVHPDHAGRGLFSVLTYEGMRMMDGDVNFTEGPTHINNYAVQQAYARLRWRMRDARHSFHKWLTG